MQLDRSKLKEEGYIGEELLIDSGVSPLDRKCFAVKQTVSDGDFTLEEALEAYGVSNEDYLQYITKYLVSEIYPLISHSSRMLSVTSSITVFGELYKMVLGSIDKDAKSVQSHLDSLAKEVSSGKIAI